MTDTDLDAVIWIGLRGRWRSLRRRTGRSAEKGGREDSARSWSVKNGLPPTRCFSFLNGVFAPPLLNDFLSLLLLRLLSFFTTSTSAYRSINLSPSPYPHLSAENWSPTRQPTPYRSRHLLALTFAWLLSTSSSTLRAYLISVSYVVMPLSNLQRNFFLV